MEVKPIQLIPIALAHNSIKEPKFGGFEKEITTIEVHKTYSRGLFGLQEYSHAIIVYWMDKETGCDIRHRPQGNPEVPVVGIFACRCPGRPNPIGITTVKILEVAKDSLKVVGLDVIDGTPILDIKPYWPQYDEVKNAKVPRWVAKLKF